jgi:hypothetical protein
MRMRILSLLIAVCAVMIPLRARAVSLTLGPDGPTSAQDRVAVLYASRNDGSTATLARVGDETFDGGQIVELGIPSETPDGRVLFGANIEDRSGHLQWDIFSADPNAGPYDRISHAMLPLGVTRGCAPALKVDPYPIATASGAIAFMAPAKEGGDALFLYRAGHVECLLRTGDRLHDGRRVAGLSFGTGQAGAGDSVALLAFLKRDENDTAEPVLWWRNHLEAVLMVSPETGVTEVAVEGTRNPQGGRFGEFSPPAAAVIDGSSGTAIAFADRSSSASSLYLYRNGALEGVMRSGTRSAAGPITFISQGRPSLGANGVIAVRAASGDRELILANAGGKTRVMARSGDLLTSDARAASFGDPLIVDGARVLFPAFDGDYDKFFAIDASGAIHDLEQSPIRPAAFNDAGAPNHAISSPTLFANPHGHFTYLGGR